MNEKPPFMGGFFMGGYLSVQGLEAAIIAAEIGPSSAT
ncbi:hypothetical protein J2W59_003256 [Pseudomonas fluorescens]|nr:hypothetical protein [Pseudomonas fluorescens]